MPKIRTSIISEHLRRRVKVLSAVASLPSIPTFTTQFYGCTDVPNQPPTAISPTDVPQKHRYTSYSQQPLLKPNVDRFNTRGRTIYNAFDCLSLEHPPRLHASHRKNRSGKRRKALPKETLFVPDVMTRSVTTYQDAHSFPGVAMEIEDLFKTAKHAHDADILQQADRLFEMYIRME